MKISILAGGRRQLLSDGCKSKPIPSIHRDECIPRYRCRSRAPKSRWFRYPKRGRATGENRKKNRSHSTSSNAGIRRHEERRMRYLYDGTCDWRSCTLSTLHAHISRCVHRRLATEIIDVSVLHGTSGCSAHQFLPSNYLISISILNQASGGRT